MGSETGSLLTLSSSGESRANLISIPLPTTREPEPLPKIGGLPQLSSVVLRLQLYGAERKPRGAQLCRYDVYRLGTQPVRADRH